MTWTIHVIGAIAGSLAQQVADPQSGGVDGGQQQRAMPEHHDHKGGEPGDVDSAVAVWQESRQRPCQHRTRAW